VCGPGALRGDGAARLAQRTAGLDFGKGYKKSLNQALDVAAAGAASGVSPGWLALIKGLEYACLELVLAGLSRRATASWRAYAGTGAAHGVIFGDALLVTLISGNPAMPVAARVTTGLNELLFPLGCSLAIYATSRLGSAKRRWGGRTWAEWIPRAVNKPFVPPPL
jgi:hypothetical protein